MLPFTILSLLVASTTLAWGPEYRGALYTLSQEDTQQVLISALWANGSASYVGCAPTGGKGSGARGIDPLQAADGLVVAGDWLFAVNPGSDEVSMFKIDLME